MKQLKTAIKRDIFLRFIGGLLLIAISILLLWAGFPTFLLYLFEVVLIGSGAYLMYQGLGGLKVEDRPLMRILLHEPERIVWVYSIVTERMPFGLQLMNDGLMYFKLIDGDEFTLSFPAHQLHAVSEMLNQRLPHATFGYTKEREQWYLVDPALLIR